MSDLLNYKASKLVLIAAIIGLFVAFGPYIIKRLNKKQETRAAQAALVDSTCSSIKAEGKPIDLSSVEHFDWSEGWKTWEFVNSAFKYKKYGAIEALVLDIELDQKIQSIWRFKLSNNAHLFQGKVPINSKVELGDCWELVEDIGGKKDVDKNNIIHEIGNRKIYILKLK